MANRKELRAQKRKNRKVNSITSKIRYATNHRDALQAQMSASELHRSNLDSDIWIAEFITREKELADNRIASISFDLKSLAAEIAGMQIEAARRRQIHVPGFDLDHVGTAEVS